MTSSKFTTSPGAGPSAANVNIVQRLRQRIREAKAMGFCVRAEWLDEQQATWCEIAGVKTLFVDLSQTAAEQLQQLNESLAAFAKEKVEAANRAA